MTYADTTDPLVRTMTPANPVRALTTRIGELKEDADRQIANLTLTLKQLDDTRAALNEHGVQMVVDLGQVGNAAAHARTAQMADADANTYTLPKAAA